MFSSALRMLISTSVLGLLIAASAAGFAADAKVDLKVGDKAPDFEARTDQDKSWTSAEHYGKKWIVIYFYPGDFTPGCTAQANAFREAIHKLDEQGVVVIGVSGDSIATHELFKKAQKLKFDLLADEEGALAKKFGVPVGPGAEVKAKDADKKEIVFKRGATAARWTFVIGKDGTIAYKNTKVTPADDAKKITEFIEKAGEKK